MSGHSRAPGRHRTLASDRSSEVRLPRPDSLLVLLARRAQRSPLGCPSRSLHLAKEDLRPPVVETFG